MELAKKVSVRENDALTKLCPSKRVSIVTIKLNNGEQIQKRVDFPKGEPENPLSRQELESKFRSLAKYGGLSQDECDEVINEIEKENFDLNKIMNIVCK